MRVAEVDQRHHVVVGVDVEPDARLAEPVGDAHPEHVGVEAEPRLEVGREAVDVAELPWRRRGARWSRAARAAAVGRPRSPGRGTASPGRDGRPGRTEQRALALVPRDVEVGEVGAGVVERAVLRQLERRSGRGPARRPRRARGSTARRCRRAAPDRPPASARPAPNCSCQRADASSRSATRRQTWSSRWSRITARGPRRPSARPRPREWRARRGASGPRPASARRARRGRRPTPRSCS